MPRSFLRFPLHLDGATVQRVDEVGALVQLLQIMANTARGSWAALPDFGLKEELVDVPEGGNLSQPAVDRINRALNDLGCGICRIESIARDDTIGLSHREFRVTCYIDGTRRDLMGLGLTNDDAK